MASPWSAKTVGRRPRPYAQLRLRPQSFDAAPSGDRHSRDPPGQTLNAPPSRGGNWAQADAEDLAFARTARHELALGASRTAHHRRQAFARHSKG